MQLTARIVGAPTFCPCIRHFNDRNQRYHMQHNGKNQLRDRPLSSYSVTSVGTTFDDNIRPEGPGRNNTKYWYVVLSF
jgi:hypothetical protein